MLSIAPLHKKFITLRHDYLMLDRNLIILEASSNAHHFAYCDDDLRVGEDVRLPFPELVGLEDIFNEILEGRRLSCELEGVARFKEQDSSASLAALASYCATESNAMSSPSSPSLYFDLSISDYFDQDNFEKRLLIVFEDTTKQMVLQQNLIQQANESSLLASSLAASKTYIDSIIGSMADALIVTTASGIIKTVNQAAQNLFGYSHKELIGKTVENLIREQKFLQKIYNFPTSVCGELLKDVEVSCQTKTGEEIPIAFSCSAIQTDVEGVRNFIYIGRDISERKRAEAEMLKALERERELRELKSRFISMASHEFRNPLAAILSSTELLEYYNLALSEDKKVKYYDRVKGAVRRMTELLDDVLLISKAESGKLEFNPKPLLLEEFCGDLVEETQLGIGKQHQINFVYSGQGTNACMDEKLLLHILSNLLTNAIKYSPQGSNVSFGCCCQDGEVIFEVQDQGIGIPPEDQERLFESFHRAKNVGTIPGTGLGLAIVKKSVGLHRGTIEVNSTVGVGTTFRVTLPLSSQESEARGQE